MKLIITTLRYNAEYLDENKYHSTVQFIEFPDSKDPDRVLFSGIFKDREPEYVTPAFMKGYIDSYHFCYGEDAVVDYREVDLG